MEVRRFLRVGDFTMAGDATVGNSGCVWFCEYSFKDSDLGGVDNSAPLLGGGGVSQ